MENDLNESSNEVNDVSFENTNTSSTQKYGDRDVLNLDNYIPFYLASVNNKLASGASSIYREKFDIGIVEWRVISMLAIEHGINAQRICDKIGLDKGATSKALKTLFANGKLHCIASKSDQRQRTWWLNDKGFELHDQIISIALEREKKLTENISPDDLNAFHRTMKLMKDNLKNM
ncbi:MAG: MarR family winged helix-turn-helix transcriptional regulator [Hyphomicrobiales bacterium]